MAKSDTAKSPAIARKTPFKAKRATNPVTPKAVTPSSSTSPSTNNYVPERSLSTSKSGRVRKLISPSFAGMSDGKRDQFIVTASGARYNNTKGNRKMVAKMKRGKWAMSS